MLEQIENRQGARNGLAGWLVGPGLLVPINGTPFLIVRRIASPAGRKVKTVGPKR
jgi:hypothetical protein